MAYGTGTIRRVQKIFGPGNAYVVTAKRLVVGHVAIDLLPGPSELLVLADDTANPKFVAADMRPEALVLPPRVSGRSRGRPARPRHRMSAPVAIQRSEVERLHDLRIRLAGQRAADVPN